MRKRLVKLSSLLVLTFVITGWWAAGARNSHDSNRRVMPQRGQPVDLELGANLSHEEMASQSDLIAIGRCTGTRSQWFARNLFTMATVSVSEVIKGDQVSSVTVALPGGIDANRKFPVAMTYEGAPTMQPNEEVFLFLSAKDQIPETYGVVGFSQGKFSIIQDAEGQRMISRDLTSPTLTSRTKTVRGVTKTIPLSEFKSRIEDYVRHR